MGGDVVTLTLGVSETRFGGVGLTLTGGAGVLAVGSLSTDTPITGVPAAELGVEPPTDTLIKGPEVVLPPTETPISDP
jgi:hypothetical protein